MIIRDSNSLAQWTALRRALGGRGPRFVTRESLPDGTLAWSPERLPLVLVSPDVREQLTSRIRLVPALGERLDAAPRRRRAP